MSKKKMTDDELIQELRRLKKTQTFKEPTEKEKEFEKKFRAQFGDRRKKKQ